MKSRTSAPEARSKTQLRRFDAMGAKQFTCAFCGSVRDTAEALQGQAAPLTGVEFLQQWMRTPNPMLGDITPLEILKMGKGDRLALFIEAAYHADTVPPV